MNDSAGLIAFKVNGTLKAISWGHHQHPAQIFLMNKPARNGKLSNGFNKSTRRANHPRSLSIPLNKNILIFRSRKSVYIHSILFHSEGRFANVTNVGMGCGGRGGT
jgi:hypothetical protein